MEWSKIPTNLINGKTDKEILAIVKYQLLYALYEEEPNKNILSRFLTKTQQLLIQNYVKSVAEIVKSDLKVVQKKRKINKLQYAKNKKKNKNSDSLKDVCQTSQIRLDKIREDKKYIKKNIEETKIDYLTHPIIEQVFSIYKEHCTNLVKLDRFYNRNVELKKMVGSYLDQTESDLEYFTRVCDIANRTQKIGSYSIDLKMILKNHDGFYNGKYSQDEEKGECNHDDLEWIKKISEESPEESSRKYLEAEGIYQ